MFVYGKTNGKRERSYRNEIMGLFKGLAQHFGVHMGNYKDWKEAIINRVEKCLLAYGVNKLQIKRLIREFEPSKNKLIKWYYALLSHRMRRYFYSLSCR